MAEPSLNNNVIGVETKGAHDVVWGRCYSIAHAKQLFQGQMSDPQHYLLQHVLITYQNSLYFTTKDHRSVNGSVNSLAAQL